jgi:hypothetical protein
MKTTDKKPSTASAERQRCLLEIVYSGYEATSAAAGI